MSRQQVSIPTPDGDARAFAFTPDQGRGPWPAVIMYMDAMGMRPTMDEMAERLASNGYFVLLPDMYWRLGGYEPMDVRKVFSEPEKLGEVFGKYMSSTDSERSMRDTGAFLDWLAKQPQASAQKVGVTGYCMGGGMALRAAASYPDRIAAAAAFHAGNVVSDAPDSPHKVVSQIKAKVLFAGADEDSFLTEEQFGEMKTAIEAAGLDAEVTIYRGALHGYAVPDNPAFESGAAERHWEAMLKLFGETLK